MTITEALNEMEKDNPTRSVGLTINITRMFYDFLNEPDQKRDDQIEFQLSVSDPCVLYYGKSIDEVMTKYRMDRVKCGNTTIEQAQAMIDQLGAKSEK
jgi:hypothetical protein